AAGANYATFRIDQNPDTTHYAGYNYTDPLAAGASQTFNTSVGTAGLSLGQHTLWIGTDTWNNVAEGNESNNLNSVTFNVVAPLVPEIAVSGNATDIVDGDLSPGSSDGTDFGSVVQGTTVDRVFTVANTGTAALTTSGLTLP